MVSLEDIKSFHAKTYCTEPEHVGFAPGRVNIIGEHTDYNDGYVLPVAIKQGTYVSVSTKPSTVTKMNFISSIDNKLVSIERQSKEKILEKYKGKWFMYVYGVIDKLLTKIQSEPKEYSICVMGDVPLGSGLSSSASIEVATGITFLKVLNIEMTGIELGLLAVDVEHEYTGVMCGIMDQFASRLCKKNTALLLDCKTHQTINEPVVLGDCLIMITNSNAPHKLESSQYNERVKQCQEAVRQLNEHYHKNEKFLRGFTVDEVQILTGIIGNRAKHVVNENDRVIKAIAAMKVGNVEELGKLMTESHMSLRNLFEVSSEELDYLVDNALKINGVFGSRLTGAGFGGCTVTLLKPSAVDEYKKMLEVYKEKFNLHPFCFILNQPEDGAHLIF
ncbi:galactokinase, putative [Entamoeba histolytica HM-1:IMSS-B]|uniref:Galactokinase, putative n=6 Tax=Entamoeba histolytica TaxID=5759 RepID=C4LYJ7_ENTH1|nr:galactokinase, putative [Entamoeba histolytica HM-1:IMSS]EMD44118.1 galactokinase, putative [Entamoeba histolytica KU27]EMH78264.1 galactokinase, putative [Entamoeba histolytica HM-1:IMSS-B]EMS12807.1 galactokinase [Entamoeba histolytica HM-3:IMSS]ENY60044.1 galactokinase, putative [Entamoeba histolytica HM-1:IMSS-A]BAN37600.1 galactokinase, putative [Entamoeba histolytica]|eukprot:XP_649045.1 galactokinase, putative [Entamoeba histolytica HM-1:IMSS]